MKHSTRSLWLLAGMLAVPACKDQKPVSPRILEPVPLPSFSSPLHPTAYESLKSTPALYKVLAPYQFPSTRTEGDFSFSLEAAIDIPAQTTKFTLAVTYNGTAPFNDKIRVHYLVCGAQQDRHEKTLWSAACFIPLHSAVLQSPVLPGEIRTVQESLQNAMIGGSYRYYTPHVQIHLPGHTHTGPIELGVLLGP